MTGWRRRLVIGLNVSCSVIIAAAIAGAAALWLTPPARQAPFVLAQGGVLATEPVRLRHSVRYRVRRPAPARPQAIAPDLAAGPGTVRVIPIRRWKPWCDRIGGLEC